jgi:hypothetical protein
MEVVIDIDKELYDSIQSKLNWNEDLQQKDIKTLLLAVDSGVIIPKRHGRLIDAQEYEDNIRKHYFDNKTVIRCTEIALDNTSTIIEEVE